MSETIDPVLRAQEVREAFHQRFDSEAVLYRAPGRVNLIGEHTDYNEGFVMPMTTGLHSWVAIKPRDDRILRAHSVLFDETIEVDLDQIGTGQDHWADYLRAVAWVLIDEGHALGGADLLIDSDLPLGGGLSSSASLELALAHALLGDEAAKLAPIALAKWCRRAENEYIGVPCGIMDQLAVAAAPAGHIVRLDCRNLSAVTVPLPEDLSLLVVDSGVRHALADGQYSQRRQDCTNAVLNLAKSGQSYRSLRDVPPVELVRGRRHLNDQEFRRARHVLEENQRVTHAHMALTEPDIEWLGRLINESHASLRDLFEVSCEELDALTDLARSVEGVLGARMVGGGFGGCALVLIREEQAEAATREIVKQYAQRHGQTPWHHRVCSTPPAGRVTA